MPGSRKRFGPFELDARSGELRTNGTRIKLQGQPIQVLELLLETPGELVTREEIRQRLWSSDTFVDFDHNLNTAIKKLRQALGDEAETPRYIETVPKRGYRFVGAVENGAAAEAAAPVPAVLPDVGATKAEPASRIGQGRGTKIAVVAAAVLLLVVLGLAVGSRMLAPKERTRREPVRSQLDLRGPNTAWFALAGGFFALSPDAHYVAYVSPQGTLRLRDLEQGSDEELPGTIFESAPFWSPDGRYLGFKDGSKVKKLALDSRLVTTLCDKGTGGASWGKSGLILITTEQGVETVSAEDGTQHVVLPAATDMVDAFPTFLPDGKHFLFVRMQIRQYLTRGGAGTVYVGSIDGTARSLDLAVSGPAVYSTGALLYPTDRGLFAQPFDLDAGRLSGEPVLLEASEGVNLAYTTSENGVLLARRVARDTEITLYARDGKPEASPIVRGLVDQARFSPDGSRLAYDQIQGDIRDIWIYDVARRVNVRLTPGDSHYYGPVWSPDGKRIAYSFLNAHTRGVAIRNVDGSGSPQVVVEASNNQKLYHWVRSWSGGGDCLFITVTEVSGRRGIGVQCLKGDNKLQILPNPKAVSRNALAISRDGKWLAYTSTETGRLEVFVQPYPGPGDAIRVSTDGGNFAEWRQDGRELFYVGGNGKIWVVSIDTAGNAIKVGEPVEMFGAPQSLWAPGIPFAAAPDGRRFAVTTSTLDPNTPFDLLVNWDAALQK